MSSEQPLLKHFVRDTLECNCPAAVFQRVEISALPIASAAWPHALRINIGNRLLVYLLPGVAVPPDHTAMADLLKHGIKERNQGGFNRLRLVIGCDDPASIPDDSFSELETLFPGDDKVHLHLLPTSVIPARFD